ncbi:Retrovirus-related Pol polyprotein from transposon opus [Hypsizygus marmoreus]|uniref:Retrovirus-related Pol polyprotein from transposon opus n=1 Tax=Hypsizygus marmoreus TaxID=39966 RepID=A0A369JFM3_HYPMA|nr:Retrovirus-related Pol polyprotein from transposon opus [Hypsizygus marmoreus]
MAKTQTENPETKDRDSTQPPDKPQEFRNEFEMDDEQFGSPANRLQLYSTKPHLQIQDIEDRGRDLNRHIARFALIDKLLDPLELTVNQLQLYLNRVSELSSRRTIFKVDPFDMFMHSLKGAGSLEELHASWIGLQKRIVLADRNITKYESEVVGGNVLNSPTSTNPELYNTLLFTRGAEARLNYILGNVPHHKEDFPESIGQALRDSKEDKLAFSAPSPLLKAFPTRPWEKDPPVVRYSSTGQRVELPPADWQRRTSDEQSLPKVKETTPQADLTEEKSSTPKPSGKVQESPAYDKPHNPLHPAGPSFSHFSPLMGPNVSFKMSNEFFEEHKGPKRETPPHQSMDESNILHGLGAGTPSSRRRDHNPKDWGWYHNRRGKRKGKERETYDEQYLPGDREGIAEEKRAERNDSRPQNPGNSQRDRGDKDAKPPRNERDADQNQHRQRGQRDDERPAPRQDRIPKPEPDPSSSSDSSDSDDDDRRGRSRGWNPKKTSQQRDESANSRDAPYGTVIPTVKADIKIDDLPTWDGRFNSAIQYFSDVQELADMGGYLPEALGSWLWTKLKQNSDIRRWFTLLDKESKSWAKTHYKNYLTLIKDSYLGRPWQLEVNQEFNSQSFRQAGHDYETPRGFIQRRILYTRMLTTTDDGGREEVRVAMLRAPLSWHSIIQASSIHRTIDLYSAVTENEKALIQASKVTAANVVTADNLVSMLRRVGVTVDPIRRPMAPISRPTSGPIVRNVHALDHSTRDETSEDQTATHLNDLQSNEFTDQDDLLRNVYQTFVKRQRDPPPDGYPFPKNDHVITRLKRPPPSPCKVCGSEKHWDKECPDWDTYLATQKRSAKWVTTEEQNSDLDIQYSSAYNALRDVRVSDALQLLGSSTDEHPGFEPAALDDPDKNSGRQECKTAAGALTEESPSTAQTEQITQTSEAATAERTMPGWRRATVEEIDDEYWLNEGRMPAARTYIIEAEDEMSEHEIFTETANVRSNTNDRDTEEHHEVHTTEKRFTWPKYDFRRHPVSYEDFTPSPDGPMIRLPKKRLTSWGRSASGVSVLSMKGWVGSIYNRKVDLRLDSGADITLISEEFYRSLISPPPLHKGVRLKLWQVTDKGTSIEGFVRIPIIVEDERGCLLETEAEAYVVPNMTVPILLGEDYQLTYEICPVRSIADGTTVEFGRNGPVVRAEAASSSRDFERLRQSTFMNAHFIRAKTHRRKMAKKRRQNRTTRTNPGEIRAAEDYRIRPHECKNIEVVGDLGEDKQWLLEKNLLANEGNEFFVVPNVLFSSSCPRIPVSNTSPHPRFIRKGEVIGLVTDPTKFFDTPTDLKTLEDCLTRTALLSSVIEARRESDTPKYDDAVEKEQDEYGPKTAAMPDPEVYLSSDMKEHLDVGSLPDHLREKAWTMLRKRHKAFGFDGRLGRHPARVHIRTVDGQHPIAVPMYGSSPAKRLIIDEQLDKWFEQEVIEPSISPWSAPVVIAYRNGKPRFCVDYRKLNAATIPDEFPIPRQSEILSSLSGAQVLSSLDALAGFTQLEMSPEDIEKTAFRTHRGLFQFRRMPFGLRNGPSIFQRIMQSVLSPYLWLFCLVYIDDIVIYSKTYEDHIEHLDRVLEAVEKAGLTLSPKKCHLFYSSILLLGHKVSRLGLSTHLEKVKAILDLERPKKLSQLQSFLGMVVYFSAFIPHYASICAPLFLLLRKGTRWNWGANQEYAFKAAKDALRSAPVLGHPIEGRPYRLYTDASDEALGCCLQQIQPIAIRDLKGTKAYVRLEKAYKEGKDVPKLTSTLTDRINDSPSDDKWAPVFEDTIVHVERVIGYWSRMFRSAEQRYATTEREALAAKEGLVKFQPFIEGEKITLVTDHSALQWARTYENSNRRLAAWGAIFSAFNDLVIVHRAGRVHSNVDPLSRLPRAPPDHVSPEIINEPAIQASDGWREVQEDLFNKEPAKHATFVAWDLKECTEGTSTVWATTRSTTREQQTGSPPSQDTNEQENNEGDILPPGEKYRELFDPPMVNPHIHVKVDDDTLRKFLEGYQIDGHLRERWNAAKESRDIYIPGSRYFVDHRDLLYFRDADFQPKLCVPRTLRDGILLEAHETAYETAHAGPEKLWNRLQLKFYWHRMKKDILQFCASCDVCQKTKPVNFKKFGTLIPNPIPSKPYESVSMDFVVNLPWSDGYNAVFVVVDRLTKHAQFIPTTTGLTAEEFGALFAKNVGCRYGLPETIVCDRDPRWTSTFWLAVAAAIGTKMSLSSSHHPQHDGQTEIVNKQLETMLRAYVAGDKASWSEWLHVLEYAYNSAVHASTGMSPFFLLHGFQPRKPLDLLANPKADAQPYMEHPEAKEFLLSLDVHRESARQAIAKAQDRQARTYNKGRRPTREFPIGSKVLVNPHTLEWVESKGEGAKLVQRWIGPFEVAQRINPKVYRLKMSDKYSGSPVFNIDHLKPYIESSIPNLTRSTLPETRQGKPEAEEYDVEKIVGHRFNKKSKKMEYLVRWLGYGPQFDTWQSTKDLKNAPWVVATYRKHAKL